MHAGLCVTFEGANSLSITAFPVNRGREGQGMDKSQGQLLMRSCIVPNLDEHLTHEDWSRMHMTHAREHLMHSNLAHTRHNTTAAAARRVEGLMALLGWPGMQLPS